MGAVSEKMFESTGPHGHRGRMRGKLLAHGPGALADYELLEMLLFLGIARRDTKPLAKATLNRFGGLAETLAAPPDALAHLGHSRRCPSRGDIPRLRDSGHPARHARGPLARGS